MGSSGENERESPLLSSEEESSASTDVGGVRLVSSDESRGAVPKLGTTARVTGEAGERKRVCFAPSPRVIPDAWFQIQSEGVRFSSKEEEEQLRNKLQGLTVEDIEPGEGGAPRRQPRQETETRNETETVTKDEA